MIPESLQTQIELLLNHISLKDLAEASSALSSKYKENDFSLDDPLNYLAYLAARLPATFAVIQTLFNQIPPFHSLLDLGAGPGTSFYASGAREAILMERDQNFIEIGKKLHPDEKINWIRQDFTLAKEFPQADVVLFSYSLGECSKRYWPKILHNAARAAKEFLILIEPGTKEGYQRILQFRDLLIQEGLYLLAPCPHSAPCPLDSSDWCHFSARLSRSRLHRIVKQGTLGYEDEKYSYLIFSKHRLESAYKRILSPPKHTKGLIQLKSCTRDGLKLETISKKEDNFKSIKKLKWGDSYDS